MMAVDYQYYSSVPVCKARSMAICPKKQDGKCGSCDFARKFENPE